MVTGRLKCLIHVLNRTGRISKLRLDKVMFLISRDIKITSHFKFYGFVPYKYGPYSFELFHDLQTLVDQGRVLADGNNLGPIDGSVDLSNDIMTLIDDHLDSTTSVEDTTLIDGIYAQYPEYAVLSKLRGNKKYMRDRNGILTIGYEGLSIDEFLKLLVDEKVNILVDIRNNPWSMKYGFMRSQLESFCRKLGIDYLGLPNLGVPANLRAQLKTSGEYRSFFDKYTRILQSEEKDLRYLSDVSRNMRLALMCFESEPARCHRSVLGEQLARRGAEVAIH